MTSAERDRSRTRDLPGLVLVERECGHVSRVEFMPVGTMGQGRASRVARLADREPGRAELKAVVRGLSPFVRDVLTACSRIPKGRVRTYGELARVVGKPGAARAVGQVMARNPVPLLIPCHRVVRSGGCLGGFGGGRRWKEYLLAREGWRFAGRGDRRRLAGKVTGNG